METAISIRAARNGFGFVSMEALRNYAGNHSVVPAQHKADSRVVRGGAVGGGRGNPESCEGQGDEHGGEQGKQFSLHGGFVRIRWGE